MLGATTVTSIRRSPFFFTMQAFYCDHFVLPLPDGHRFPMSKYRRLRQAVVAGGVVAPAELAVPAAASDEELRRAHSEDWVARVSGGRLSRQEIRRIGFPWSPELVERSRRSVGGTLAACRAALADGVAVNLAGGTHHAFADFGAGFCVFNDAAVAARALLAEEEVERLVVIDCDVHQGDGTAAIFADDPAVYTLSLHGAGNFPFRKQTSDLDLALPDGTGDEEYLAALDQGLEQALTAGRPELAIYVAGADPFEGDRLGRLALTRQGLAERDRRVFAACRAAGVPVATVMAGGYAHDVADTVAIHLETVRQARRTEEPWRQSTERSAANAARRQRLG